MNLHNLTTDDVLALLPMAEGTVTETSRGLNRPTIEKWLTTAAGILNALLERNGNDPDDLGGHAEELLRDGMISYAVARCLTARGYDQEAITPHWQAWQEARRTLREMSPDLGDDDHAESVQSNIDVQAGQCTGWGKNFPGF